MIISRDLKDTHFPASSQESCSFPLWAISIDSRPYRLTNWAAEFGALYEKHQDSRRHLFEGNPRTFRRALEILKTNPPLSGMFADLDKFYEKTKIGAALFRDLVLGLPATVIKEKFGVTPLFFAAVRCIEPWEADWFRAHPDSNNRYNKVLKAIEETYCFDIKAFKFAHFICIKLGISKSEAVFQAYKLVHRHVQEIEPAKSAQRLLKNTELERTIECEIKQSILSSKASTPIHPIMHGLRDLFSFNDTRRQEIAMDEIERCLQLSAAVVPHELSLQELDAIHERGDDYSALRRAIAWLNPDLVHKIWGLEPLKWAFTAFTDPTADRHYSEVQYPSAIYKDLRRYLAQDGGINTDVWERAGRVEWYLNDRSVHTGTVEAEYRLLTAQIGFDVAKVDIAKIAAPYLIEGADVKFLDQLSLQTLNVAHKFMGRALEWKSEIIEVARGVLKYDIYVDAPTAFAILHNGRPIGVFAMFCSTADTVCHCQLQGSRAILIREGSEPESKPTRCLAKLKRPRLFEFDVAMHVGQELGFERHAIRSSLNNFWTHRPQTLPNGRSVVRYPQSKAQQDYDGLANFLHFPMGKDGNWYAPPGFKITPKIINTH